MRIIGGPQFLTFAAFLDSIELISSRTSLDVLFPGYNGVLPYLQEYRGDIHTFENFQFYNGTQNVFNPDTVFLRRNNVIVGSRWHRIIDAPYNGPGHEEHYVVFNISHTASDSKWIELARADFRKLGPFRRFILATERDKIVRAVVRESHCQGSLRAQKLACISANAAADQVEEIQLMRLGEGRATIPAIIERVFYQFRHVYNEVYERITNSTRSSSSRTGPS